MKKALGVLGGMGPQATAGFLQKVINITDAEKDSEHIRIFADINPQIPDRTQAIINGGESPVKAIAESLKRLVQCGAGCIVMPCVTAHYFYSEVVKHLESTDDAVFLNLPEVVSAACETNYPGKTACILSTNGTKISGVLKNELASKGISFIEPDDNGQETIMRLIYNVKADMDMEEITKEFTLLADKMKSLGADYFILGCTEIPLIVDAYDFPYPVLDSTLELAKSAVLSCGYKLKQEKLIKVKS